MSGYSRRRFLSHLLGGTAAAASAPVLFLPHELRALGPDGSPTSLHSLLGEGAPDQVSRKDEAYWARVKDQFPLAPELILLNAANLCPSPYPVQDAVFRHTRDVDRDPSFQNRGKFGELKEEARRVLASYVGVSPEEIAITRNTSEGNNSVVNGLDLGPGDEVVIWDQNHPTNNVAWDVRARRWGFSVRRVSTPPGAVTEGALAAPFMEALSSRTRVLAFSHVSNVSGIALPARRLCEAARERGVFTLVDGAQTFGALKLDLGRMECDVFTASSHKWFVGPKEAGLMYVKASSQERLWPSDVGVGWESAREEGARKFENMGQRDDAAVVTMATTVAFHEAIGPEAMEDRVRALATRALEGLEGRLSGVAFHTPLRPELRAGVVVFRLPGTDHDDLHEALYRERGVASAPMHGAFEGLRFSPHVYNTAAEVDEAVEAVVAVAGNRPAAGS